MLRDGLISLAITAMLLLVVNFLLVHYALAVFKQPDFPRALLKYVDPCYLTIYHDTHDNEFRDWIAVVGDSYAAGSGDEFLDRKPDYGIFPKLRSLTHGNYFVFARGGFGNINAAKELMLCMNIFNDSFLLPRIESPKEVMFLFYEGNDLDNNFDHLQHSADSEPVGRFVRDQVSRPDGAGRRALALHFPLFYLIGGQFSRLGRVLPGYDRNDSKKKSETGGGAGNPDGPAAAGDPDGNTAIIRGDPRLFPGNPQSASAELTGRLDLPLQVFFESVLTLKERLPGTRITIVYMPSVVTAYTWQDPIRVEAYHTDAPVFTTNRDNDAQSHLIRQAITDFAASNQLGFVDPTASLQSAAATEFIHGPRDWRHLNSKGNWIVARSLADWPGAPTTPGATAEPPGQR